VVIVRLVLLVIALVFTAAIAVATVLDAIHHGVNAVDVLAGLIVILFATGLIGALTHRPPS
jgi:hypothetical protein